MLASFGLIETITMRFLEWNEIAEWSEQHGPEVQDDLRPVVPALPHRERVTNASGRRSGRELTAANACIGAAGHWNSCMLIVTGWGVWPSSEGWPQ